MSLSSTPDTPPSASSRRRNRQREDAQRAILDATEALLVESGYEAFSMRRLAARCGYTAPTIYHYFSDKQGLLDAVLDARLRLAMARLDRVPWHDDPAQMVRGMVAEFVRFGLEHPAHHRLMSLARPGGEPLPAAADEIGARFETHLEALAAAGRLRGGDIEQALQFIWMLLHGIVSLQSSRPDVEWKQSIVDYSVEAAVSGLVIEGSPRARTGGKDS